MEQEEWNEVDTTTPEEEKNKVEYEIEGEIETEEKAIPLVETKKENFCGVLQSTGNFFLE